jgi:hypothetical protein
MSKFQQQMETRTHFRQIISQLKSQGVTVPQLIEAMRNELQLLHIEDDRNAEASTKSLSGSGADLLPNRQND